MAGTPLIAQARQDFHAALIAGTLTIDKDGIPSNADSSNAPSIAIAKGLIARIGTAAAAKRQAGQKSGKQFEVACHSFLKTVFSELSHLRPGDWTIELGKSAIAEYAQYEHLSTLQELASKNADVAAALGSDYLIKPDIVVARSPETDKSINARMNLIGGGLVRHSVLRAQNNQRRILHASVSCKWTIRSDRAQNARSEGLNLVKNRKGHLPHIAVITAEPTPSRIASIALGTGEIDCVYHFALPELQETLSDLGKDDAAEMLRIMIEGKRLRDIADLPLDLAV